MPRFISLDAERPSMLPAVQRKAIESTLDLAAAQIEGDQSVAFGEVTILLVDVERIVALHEAYFSDPTPTDIITFPAESRKGSEIEGDIAICLEVAGEQADEAGHSLARELEFLGIHGLLHLAGWADTSAAERDAMLARQDEILRAVVGDDGA